MPCGGWCRRRTRSSRRPAWRRSTSAWPGAERVAGSEACIRVTDVEHRLGTRYAVDTLAWLRQRHPESRFVWVMGADNMIEVPRWKRWRTVFRMLPIAVFARPTYSLRALSGRAARRFAAARVRESRARALAEMTPPAWVFVRIRPEPASATQIRAATGPGGGARET